MTLREQALAHIAEVRRERWKTVAIYGAFMASELALIGLCVTWGLEPVNPDWMRLLFAAGAVSNAWAFTQSVVGIRKIWMACKHLEAQMHNNLAVLEAMAQVKVDTEIVADDEAPVGSPEWVKAMEMTEKGKKT